MNITTGFRQKASRYNRPFDGVRKKGWEALSYGHVCRLIMLIFTIGFQMNAIIYITITSGITTYGEELCSLFTKKQHM